MHNQTYMDRQRLVDRGMDEFIGICRGILFDGMIAIEEAVNLTAWLQANPMVAETWPASEVFDQLNGMLSKGHLSPEDEGELMQSLAALTGDPRAMHIGESASSQLPLSAPAPEVFFENAVFVITGNLKLGPRKQVIELIESMGGKVPNNVRKDTDFLIIGDIGSKAWMHSTHGRKIEKAIELRDQHKTGLAIISEVHFVSSLPEYA